MPREAYQLMLDSNDPLIKKLLAEMKRLGKNKMQLLRHITEVYFGESGEVKTSNYAEQLTSSKANTHEDNSPASPPLEPTSTYNNFPCTCRFFIEPNEAYCKRNFSMNPKKLLGWQECQCCVNLLKIKNYTGTTQTARSTNVEGFGEADAWRNTGQSKTPRTGGW